MTEKITPAGPKPSPAKMLSELSNRTTLMWIGVALVIHIVIFGVTSLNATSLNYLRGKTAESAAPEAETPAANPAPAPAPAGPRQRRRPPSPRPAKPPTRPRGWRSTRILR